jgi:hypothetical protein
MTQKPEFMVRRTSEEKKQTSPPKHLLYKEIIAGSQKSKSPETVGQKYSQLLGATTFGSMFGKAQTRGVATGTKSPNQVKSRAMQISPTNRGVQAKPTLKRQTTLKSPNKSSQNLPLLNRAQPLTQSRAKLQTT